MIFKIVFDFGMRFKSFQTKFSYELWFTKFNIKLGSFPCSVSVYKIKRWLREISNSYRRHLQIWLALVNNYILIFMVNKKFFKDYLTWEWFLNSDFILLLNRTTNQRLLKNYKLSTMIFKTICWKEKDVYVNEKNFIKWVGTEICT